MPTTRSAKRRRRGDDLLSLYQGDLGDKILSYASGQDLCTLDLLSKQFQALTTKQWKKVTKERFGMDNGKDGWRLGTSFLREPVVIKLTDEGEDEWGLYMGSPKVAANESITAITSDMTGNDEISILDASTLNYIQTDDSDITNFNITICGSVGSEIIVTSNTDQIYAQRESESHHESESQCWDYTKRALHGIQSIGSESHLIIPFNGKIEIYEVNGVGESTLLSLRRSVSVEKGAGDEDGFINELIAWGPDKSCFVVGYPHQICVWNFDAVKNNISLANTITVYDWEVINVALADDYIIAATKYKQIHIWDRITGAKVFDALCDTDVDDIDMLIEDDFIYPLRMSIHGHILVTTSHIGNGLCVWDMKTGQLLKRHEYQREEDEPTAMVYLKHINGFLCMVGCMKIWSFPTNQNQSERAISIRRRKVAESLHANAADDT